MISLFRGDCLDILPTVKDKAVLLFADLPYNSTGFKWDLLINVNDMWPIFTYSSNTQLIMAGHKSRHVVQSRNIDNFKYPLIWDKKFAGNFTQVKRQPLFTHEEIMVFGDAKYYPQMIQRDFPIKSGKNAMPRHTRGTDNIQTFEREQKTYTEKYPTSIIRIARPIGKKKVHPTEKPVELLEYLIKSYTQEGDLVIDPCMGSGSTGVAARNLNRSFIGIEKDKNYFNIAKERIENEL